MEVRCKKSERYIDKLQSLQFRGIQIIYNYYIDGRSIKNSDEENLHNVLGLTYLKDRRKRHILHMMFNLTQRRPDMLDVRDKEIVIRSSSHININEERLHSEIYVKNPYVRGCNIWKQLPAHIQKARTKIEFNQLLTEDLLNTVL